MDGMELYHPFILGNLETEKQTIFFLSFMDNNFESLDMHVLFKITVDVSKLISSHRK